MKLSNLGNVLRAAGLTVVETDGWAGRGYKGQDLQAVAGGLWHHTATHRSRFANEDAPTLSMCIGGREDLPGPLCNIVFGRDGTVYLVAAGVANHAGYGSAAGIPRDMGNHYLIGIEMESSGIAPWDWTDDQLRVAPYLGAALEKAYGFELQIAHYEYSSQGKIDPAGWPGGMDGLRDQINAVLNGTALTAEGEDVALSNEDVERIVKGVLDFKVNRAGNVPPGQINLGLFMAWSDANNAAIIKANAGEISALREVVKQLAVKQGAVIDYEAIAKVVAEAVNDDAAERMKS